MKSHRLAEGDLLVLYRNQQGAYVSLFVYNCAKVYLYIYFNGMLLSLLCCNRFSQLSYGGLLSLAFLMIDCISFKHSHCRTVQLNKIL